MNFVDDKVSREHMFTLGRETENGWFYLSFPVRNRMVEYNEFYRLTELEHQLFIEDEDEALQFAEQCRKRLNDDRLILKPGSDRGFPL
jgi:hypothetical protein